MPARAVVTARQERLGTELRRLREQAGLTVRETARSLSIDQTKISHIESGRVGVSEERLRRMTAHYACGDHQLVDALAEMAAHRHRGWWERYRDALPAGFLDLAELEHHASFLRSIAMVNVPGLLQTEDYARAVFSYAVPSLSIDELAVRVNHRMQRKTVITQTDPVEFSSVIHEAALRIMVADRKTARQQLSQILDMSETDSVSVRVISFDAEGFAGANYSMLHGGGPVPKLDTVQLDGPGGSGLLNSEAQLNKYRMMFEKIAQSSKSCTASREHIYRVLNEL